MPFRLSSRLRRAAVSAATAVFAVRGVPAHAAAPALHCGAESRRALLRLCVASLLAGLEPALAQEALESSVKAAYLFKFMDYVEWPPSSFDSPDSPLTIGVLSADPVLAELEQVIKGRSVNGRALVARRVELGQAVDGLHVLFVGRAGHPGDVVRGLKGGHVLVVTESANEVPEGSALNFVLVNGRVRFVASVSAAERAGIKLSARLLAVAERVAP